jgi:hypothetical protein
MGPFAQRLMSIVHRALLLGVACLPAFAAVYTVWLSE